MNPYSKKETVVIGLGNPLMGDEGIGVHIIRALGEVSAVDETVDIVELGTSPMAVIHTIARYDKAIIVDCARMMQTPGTVCRFTPAEAVSVKSLPGLSLHECELLRTLKISAQLGEHPAEVIIFGIEPETVGPGEVLSIRLEQQLNEYVQLIRDEIGARDISLHNQGGSYVHGTTVSGDWNRIGKPCRS